MGEDLQGFMRLCERIYKDLQNFRERNCKELLDFGRGFARICETLREDLQGLTRIHKSLGEDSQGFVNL